MSSPAHGSSGAGRGIPFHCPYCGEETLRPHEDGGHGDWECRSCLRAFTLKMLGMIPRPTVSAPVGPSHRTTRAADQESSP